MRTILVAVAMTVQTYGALAQQAPLAADVGSGLGAGLSAGLGSGFSSEISSGLGSDTQRTMADGYIGGRSGGSGGGCAPTQVDPDHRGCRPAEFLRGEGLDPNRVVTYYGDSAFRSSGGSDPDARF